MLISFLRGLVIGQVNITGQPTEEFQMLAKFVTECLPIHAPLDI